MFLQCRTSYTHLPCIPSGRLNPLVDLILLSKFFCLRLKLVELNFFVSFNADDQRKPVSNVSKYTSKSSR